MKRLVLAAAVALIATSAAHAIDDDTTTGFAALIAYHLRCEPLPEGSQAVIVLGLQKATKRQRDTAVNLVAKRYGQLGQVEFCATYKKAAELFNLAAAQ